MGALFATGNLTTRLVPDQIYVGVGVGVGAKRPDERPAP
jgi:hypothetical protein